MPSTLQEIPTLFAKYKVAKNILDRISIWNGDITRLQIDAIVNAANSRLAGGGGVDAAIHRAAGKTELQRECRQYDGCAVGEAVITSACKIEHVKNIIHTVGPQVYSSLKSSDREKLVNCYRNSLELAKENGLKSLAFCCISTGVYGYPNDDAAESVGDFLTKYLAENENIERIVLVTFLFIDYELYHEYFANFAENFE
ncbi:unnamed protein product [Caenorhabditis angaria]|uniref:Macro domain-containing protein n=1 Tax=Caenorhabditis angaria TaxID=860376 RepID=A0A9P1IMU7_9PELO|nr:unnamed protein product [Caenorhabditis angaria]